MLPLPVMHPVRRPKTIVEGDHFKMAAETSSVSSQIALKLHVRAPKDELIDVVIVTYVSQSHLRAAASAWREAISRRTGPWAAVVSCMPRTARTSRVREERCRTTWPTGGLA